MTIRSGSSLAVTPPSHRREFTTVGNWQPASSSSRTIKRNVGVGSGLRDLVTHNDKQKETKMEFYVHELRSADPTDTTATLKVANLPPNTKPLQWGSSFVFDNEVREGSGADSKLLGRERGWGVVSDQKSEEALQLLSKITFTDGDYTGSTLTFSGNVGGKVMPYELIILGGTGHFRGAHGYALADKVPNEGGRFKFHWNVFISK